MLVREEFEPSKMFMEQNTDLEQEACKNPECQLVNQLNSADIIYFVISNST